MLCYLCLHIMLSRFQLTDDFFYFIIKHNSQNSCFSLYLVLKASCCNKKTIKEYYCTCKNDTHTTTTTTKSHNKM